MPERLTRKDFTIALIGGIAGGILVLGGRKTIEYLGSQIDPYFEPDFRIKLFGENWEEVSRSQQSPLDEKEKEFVKERGCFILGYKRGHTRISVDAYEERQIDALVKNANHGALHLVLPRPVGDKEYTFVVHTPEGVDKISKKLTFLSNEQIREKLRKEANKSGESLAEFLRKGKGNFWNWEEGGINYQIYGLDALSNSS